MKGTSFVALMLVSTTCAFGRTADVPGSGKRFVTSPSEASDPPAIALLFIGTKNHPIVVLSSAQGDVEGALGTYCWLSPGAGEGWVNGCADAAGAPIDVPSIEVVVGTEMTVGGDAKDLGVTVGTFQGHAQYLAFTPIKELDLSPGSASLDFAPGEYALSAWANWERGDANVYFAMTLDLP